MLPDFYNYISADATLRSLLGATVAEPKIYPEIAPDDTVAPYIIYGPVREGSPDEVLDYMTIQVSVFVDKHEQKSADDIIFRLKTLLDKQDQISIPSDTLFIYWAKHVGGDSYFVKETREYHRAAMFAFKFKRK